MIHRSTGPAPVPRKRVARVPGHRLVAGSYSNGLAGWACECGVVQPPAPSVSTAAQRYDHLEIHVSKTEKLVASSAPFAHAGRSIFEMLWEEMDTAYDALMRSAEPAPSDDAEADREAVRTWGTDQGRARGLATALAVMTNPYAPNVDAVREKAHARWEAGLSDEDFERFSAE